MARRFIYLGVLSIVAASIFIGRHLFVSHHHNVRAAVATSVPTLEYLTPFQSAVLKDLQRQIAAKIRYEPGYFSGGDPPPQVGVCTDVVIQSYRAAGVDLRQRVDVDIRQHRSAYNVRHPDRNIDYRRVRDLKVFFARDAISLPTSGPHADWRPADVVVWSSVSSGVPNHIGIVTDHLDAKGNPTVVHHTIDTMVCEMDWLHKFPIVAHFRWPKQGAALPQPIAATPPKPSMNGAKLARAN